MVMTIQLQSNLECNCNGGVSPQLEVELHSVHGEDHLPSLIQGRYSIYGSMLAQILIP